MDIDKLGLTYIFVFAMVLIGLFAHGIWRYDDAQKEIYFKYLAEVAKQSSEGKRKEIKTMPEFFRYRN